MGVLANVSDQLADGYRRLPKEDHGKLRLAYFKFTATAEGAINTTFDLVKLPQGAVRVLPHLSRYSISAQGSSATFNIGHTAYVKDGSGTIEAASATAFVSAVDASSALVAQPLGTAIKYDMYSTSGILIQAKSTGAVTPANTVLEGFIAYVTE